MATNVRITQAAIENITQQDNPALRISQSALEVLGDAVVFNTVRLSQAVVEVLCVSPQLQTKLVSIIVG